MPLRQLQEIVDQVSDITGLKAGITDGEGYVIACSDPAINGSCDTAVSEAAQLPESMTVVGGAFCLKIPEKGKAEYIVFIKAPETEGAVSVGAGFPDPGAAVTKFLRLMSVSVIAVKSVSGEKTDRNGFIKSIITDNILPGDIYVKARELHIDTDAARVAFCVKIRKQQGGVNLYDILNSLFPNKAKDFIVMIDDSSAALIRELKSPALKRQTQPEAPGLRQQASQAYASEIQRTAETITDMVMTELMVAAVIGIGTEVTDIRDVGKSFKEAQTAIQIGSIFESDRNVINYNKLGIGRLIYQLPITLCRLFLKEVFRDKPLDEFDSEAILTIKKFYENNLNVSEASRQLYIHRNTLIYRLEKIERQTGLDLKKFEDAIILKVAMMVRRYLDSCEK